MIRKTLFWLHLGSGVITGLVVAMMSLTGVLLTYELQLIAWADRAFYAAPAPDASRLPLDRVLAAAQSDGVTGKQLTVYNDPAAPVLVSAGRREPSVFVNAYSGEVLGEPSPGIRSAMSSLMYWHRWFNATGDARQTARLVTGVSNLAFLFMILTGIYLWLPRVLRWSLLKARLFFHKAYDNAKERNFYWHHIFGIWSAIPLIIIVATASVFSFRWASNLVYIAAGEEPPQRGGGTSVEEVRTVPADSGLSLDAMLDTAAAHTDAWRTIRLTVPVRNAAEVEFEVDRGNGRQPQLRDTVVVDAVTGQVTAVRGLADRTPGSQARVWIRFLHTGEVFGVVGQTIAGVVSLASLFMVWTGFALAWRRLVTPLFRRRQGTRKAPA
jgi:uncharacterized iron-regulated membrane protein